MDAVLEEVDQPEIIQAISTDKPVNNDTIFELLLNEEDFTWQTLLYELVKTEKMDPWDIDLKILSKKFISTIKEIKKFDFRISGKIVLAAAILLKMKSNKFLLDDITAFDSLLHSHEEDEFMEDSFDDDMFEQESYEDIIENKPKIFPRTPQPRKRKVSIFDLVEALEKALDTKNKRKPVEKRERHIPKPSKDYKDISVVIGETYELIQDMCDQNETQHLRFNELLSTDTKEDKIYTFIPLLHLTNHRKIDIDQEHHFGEIAITLLNQMEKAEIKEA